MSREFFLAGLAALLMSTVEVRADGEKSVGEFKSALGNIASKERAGDLKGALRDNEALASRAREQLGPSQLDTALVVDSLGLLYQKTGQYPEAEKSFREALKIRKSYIEGNAAESVHFLAMANSCNNLGFLLALVDNYAESDRYLSSCLEYYDYVLEKERSSPKNVLLVERLKAKALRNLAVTHDLMGEYAKAKKRYEEALAVLREGEKDHSLARAGVMNDLGLLLYTMGRYQEAEPYLQKALRIRQDELGKAHFDVAVTMNNLGLLNHAMGSSQYADAEKFFNQALATMRKAVGLGDHPITAVFEHNLAGLYQSMGQKEKAAEHYRNSQRSLEKLHGPDHPEVAVSRMYLAWLQVTSGKWSEAAKEMDIARKGLRQHVSRVLSAQSETEQIIFLKNKDQRWLHTALSLCWEKPDSPDIIEKSASWVINAKAVGLQTLSEQIVLSSQAKGTMAESLKKERQAVSEKLAAMTHTTSIDNKEWDVLTKKENELSRKLAIALGVKSREQAWVDLKEVRQELKNKGASGDAVLIEFMRYQRADFRTPGTELQRKEHRYAAWIIPVSGSVRYVDLGDAKKIDDMVYRYHDDIQKLLKVVQKKPVPTDGYFRDNEKEFRKLLDDLSHQLIAPLGVNESSRWIISPDASLWLVPWSALRANDKYLVQDHTISLVATSRDLIERSVEKAPSGAPVVFSNIHYGEDGGKEAGLLRFTKLELSKAAAEAITPDLEKYAGATARSLDTDTATEDAFRKLQGPKVVVLITHGFFKEDKLVKNKNPLLQCGLAFAGANQRAAAVKKNGAQGDGVLFGKEVLEVNLRGTDLVVLSACESALGEARDRGGEGALSLQYAFQLAGARSILATLWEVPEMQTALIVRDFFEQLAGPSKGDKAEALRQAQLKWMEGKIAEGENTHPFFWAAMTLNGQPRPASK